MRAVGVTIGRFALKASVWGRNETSLQQLKQFVETSSRANRTRREGPHLTGETQARINQELDPPA